MTPILETECKAWTSLSPPAQRCASCPRPPHPLQTISPVSRAPGSIYCPSNTCPTQTETREGHEHSLAHLPACHQQTQTKPFKIPEGQHWDRKRKHRIKSEKFLSLSRHSNLADINAEVQQLRKVQQLTEGRWESLQLTDQRGATRHYQASLTMSNPMLMTCWQKLLYQKTVVSASTAPTLLQHSNELKYIISSQAIQNIQRKDDSGTNSPVALQLGETLLRTTCHSTLNLKLRMKVYLNFHAGYKPEILHRDKNLF